MHSRSRLVTSSCATLAALATLLVAGCSCAAPTLGAPCTTDRDCRSPEVCNLVTNTCDFPPGLDAGPIDTGPRPDTAGSDVPGLDAPGADVAGADVPGADGGMCTDADGDTFTDCAGDCDDADATRYPGAPEVCGDGVTNDCMSTAAPDTGCGGIGTYVAPAPLGSDTNPGTQASPVLTIGQGIRNAVTIGGGADVYVAAGTYDEDVAMVEGVSVLGGYESAGWTRNIAANLSIIDAASGSGLSFPAGITRATALDGVTARGRSGTSTSSAITIDQGSSPEIVDCVVVGGNTSGASMGIHINPTDATHTGAPHIHDTEVRVGTSGTGWGGGNGGWGIRSRRTASLIEDVHVALTNAPTIQRGIELSQSPMPGAEVRGSLVDGIGTTSVAFGIRVGAGTATLDGNVVFIPRCSDTCLGIAVEGPMIRVVVTNNVAFGGEGAMTQAGLSVAFEALPPAVPDLLIHSNFFDGGGATSGRSAGVQMGERPSAPFAVGRFFNNVIRSGSGTTRYAFLEEHMNIDPAVFQNNALFAVRSGAGGGVLYRDEGTMDLNMIATINGLRGSGMNLADDCSVVMPAVMGDFHLGTGSMCVDGGTATEAPATDFEGDARPAGTAPDIGPDET